MGLYVGNNPSKPREVWIDGYPVHAVASPILHKVQTESVNILATAVAITLSINLKCRVSRFGIACIATGGLGAYRGHKSI